MGQYKKGIITGDSIISAAKDNFKENGLKGTTIASICKKCNIKLGTFTYYYNKKEILLQTIYTSYMNKCREFIASKNLHLSPAENHIYVVAMYYYNIYSNEQIFSFHKEVLSLTSMNNIFQNPREMIDDFAADGNTSYDLPYYELFVKADNAIRREFNLNYFNKTHNSIDDIKLLLMDIYILAATMFNIDLDIVKKSVENGYEYAKKHGDKNITLL